jgi:hypothetical protein
MKGSMVAARRGRCSPAVLPVEGSLEGARPRARVAIQWNCVERPMQRWGWFGERCIRGPAGGDPPRRTGPETRVRYVRGLPPPTLARGTGRRWGCGVRGRGARRGRSHHARGRPIFSPRAVIQARRPLSMPEGSKQRPKAADLGKGAEAPKPELISAPSRGLKNHTGGCGIW